MANDASVVVSRVVLAIAPAVAEEVGVISAVAVGVMPTVAVAVGVIPAVGVGVGAVVGVGVGVGGADTARVAVIVNGEPTEGVITAVSV